MQAATNLESDGGGLMSSGQQSQTRVVGGGKENDKEGTGEVNVIMGPPAKKGRADDSHESINQMEEEELGGVSV